MNTQTLTLDVREDIRSGREPFSEIMSAVVRLLPDEGLLLVSPFEPAPFYYQFSAECPGTFIWEHLMKGPEEFRVNITKLKSPTDGAAAELQCCGGH